MLDGGYVDLVVIGMCSKPFDLHHPEIEHDPDDQPVFVAQDVEYHPVVGYDTCIAIDLFQFVEISEIAVQELVVPFQQGRFCQWMCFAVIKEGFSGDDVEHNYKATKSVPIENYADFQAMFKRAIDFPLRFCGKAFTARGQSLEEQPIQVPLDAPGS